MIRTKILSVIPMRTQVIFPNTTVGFDIGRGISLAAVERAAFNESYVFITRQTVDKELPAAEDLAPIGTVALIRQKTRMPGDRVRILAEGLYRARARDFRLEDGYLYAVTDELPPIHGDPTLEEAHFRTVKSLIEEYEVSDGKIAKELGAALTGVADIDEYLNIAASCLNFKDPVKQKLLETEDVIVRLMRFEEQIVSELEIAKLERKIAQDVRKNIDKAQKEYFLREQLRVIHSELGDDVEENEKLRTRILEKKLPKKVEEKALAELTRMDKMPPSSPE